jgi:elongation factor G
VDEGSTVTDFLPAERARGITIQSAAITFHWPPKAKEASTTSPVDTTLYPGQHTINLIDTPGHADFTFEVIRSLRILDGAICILDGVAGVEAQTEKVWHQASNYRIPRIIYVNKLDRTGAAFNRTIREIGSRLHTVPVLCQIPWWKNGKFVGVGDAVNLVGLEWQEGSDGTEYRRHTLDELKSVDASFGEELCKARNAVIEALTEQDDQMVEDFLEADEDFLAIPPKTITESLRRCVLTAQQTITPVFAGASFRNTGVQPLLDAVNNLLPSPPEASDPDLSYGDVHMPLSIFIANGTATPSQSTTAKTSKSKSTTPIVDTTNLLALALAFKVVTDPRRGVLVYVRVYHGTLSKNALLYNTSLSLSERAPRLLRMYANDALEIDNIPSGHIGVISGLKHARTGDTLLVYQGASVKNGPPSPFNELQLRPIEVPPPLFFTSVEPNSLAEEKHLADTMALLLREDPSLSVSVDTESGQTQLAGMGELHLEIARDRLIKDFKVKASTGKIEISYREALTSGSDVVESTFSREVAGKVATASCSAAVAPFEEADIPSHDSKHTQVIRLQDNNILVINHPTLLKSGKPLPGAPALPPTLPLQTIVQALTTGVSAALARGPSHALPLHSTLITINFDPSTSLTSSTTSSAMTSATRQAVTAATKAAAESSETVIMEPVMLATIAVPESSMGAVVHDLSSSRGATVLSLDAEEDDAQSSSSSSSSPNRLTTAQLSRIYAPPDPFGSSATSSHAASDEAASVVRQIRARVPLKEMVGYLKHLRSLTGGRGTFVMAVDRYERMGAQRMKVVLAEM